MKMTKGTRVVVWDLYWKSLDRALNGDAHWYAQFGNDWFRIPAFTAASLAAITNVVLTDDPEDLHNYHKTCEPW